MVTIPLFALFDTYQVVVWDCMFSGEYVHSHPFWRFSLTRILEAGKHQESMKLARYYFKRGRAFKIDRLRESV